jgi:hypothetical protein
MSTRRRLAVALVAAAAAAGAVPLFVSSGSAGAAPAPAGCPSTPSYDYTIPTPVGPPAAVSFTNEEFAETGYAALGADSKLYYAEGIIDPDPADTQVDVSPLSCLGGAATDAPGLTIADDGTRAFFVRAASGRLYQRYVTTNYSSIGAYTIVNAGASTNGPAAVQTPDGTYHMFVRGTDGALHHGYRTTSSLSSWRFERIGGAILGSPVAVVDGSTVLIAVVGTNGAIYTVRGRTAAWGPITKLTNKIVNTTAELATSAPPSLVVNPDSGQVTLFAASRTYGLYSIYKEANAGFSNAVWNRIDSVLPPNARIAAATNGQDAIVYARFTDTSTRKVLTAFTEYTADSGAWSDYYLAPYTCFDCAPYGVDDTVAGKGLAKAKLSPGKGSLARSTTRVVLRHKR